ncbi:MAG: class I SAM-dependent methyltransferase [Chloroflexi bacterium]|nr:MAG: class I SAM-dependent methyltransferase [Chloroflexota bacterium]
MGLRRFWFSLIRLGFRLLYHELAWTYDGVAWLVSRGQWWAWGERALPRLRGERVLELAHGTGHLLVTMHRAGLRPVGVDLSPQMGRLARRRLRRAGCTVPLVRARAQALPFPSASFDSVVATFPTDFIVDPRTLGEVARLLRPQGRLVVVLGARFTGRGPLARLLEGLYRITGQREPLAQDLEERFRQAGLAVWMETEVVGESAVLLLVARRTARFDVAISG